MDELLRNRTLWVIVISALLAQIFKILLILVTEKKLVVKRMVETGGMPSSHAAAVTSLATCMGIVHGFNTSYFTISLVLAGIVIYDAAGIRRAAGKHAELLNQMSKELSQLIESGFQTETLKTLLGHTYPQVFAGSLLGIIVAFIMLN